MSAMSAFEAASRIGLRIDVDGDELVLEAAAPPPADVLDLLRQFKREIIAELRNRDRSDDWTTEDWRVFFDERAGVLEFDGDLARAKAERQAYAECVTEWLVRHTIAPVCDRCLHCGRDGSADEAVVIPHATIATTGAWLHASCWPAWRAAQEAIAVEALANFGIAPVSEGTAR